MDIPYCKDCANKHKPKGLFVFLECDSCERDGIPRDPVTGESRREYCSVERLDYDKCGPTAVYFVPRNK